MNQKIEDFAKFSLVMEARNILNNIEEYYRIMLEAARDEFTEDNNPTLRHFLEECFQESFKNTRSDKLKRKDELKATLQSTYDDLRIRYSEEEIADFGVKRITD